MANNKFLANAFSLQMLKSFPCEIKVSEIAFELVGGRLPEGSTTLPEGFSFKLLKVEIL